jgi:hypothetical protein
MQWFSITVHVAVVGNYVLGSSCIALPWWGRLFHCLKGSIVLSDSNAWNAH